uniref:Secreted protein n=1 Tax=Panagrolaimus sp. JU765 TaxID=591449 RepID=A0AC34RDD2_9BILA
MSFLTIYVILTVFHVGYCQNGLFGFLNPRDIADLTQMAMQLTSQTVKSNQELMAKPGGPEVKPISSDLSPSEMFGQGLTNLMNPETAMKFLNNPQTRQPTPRGPTLPLERRQVVAEPMSELPNEFGRGDLFKPERLFSTLPRPKANAAPSVDAVPLESIAEIGKTPKTPLPAPNQPANLFGQGITPEMESSAGQLMKMATSFLRGAGGRGDSGGRDYDAPRYNQREDLIPNIRDLMPGARDNFGVQRGQGCLPFVGEFMQMAYGNCVKHADQKTFDAWGREFESVVTGRGINFFRARLFSTLPRPKANAAPSVDAVPLESIAEIGKTPVETPKTPLPAPSQPANLFGQGITPEMESSAGQLMKMATSFLRGAGGRGDSGGRDYDAPRYNQREDLIPNIRDLMPGARDNFGVQRGQGCLPFVGEFMQMAYGNCVKHADQKTFDAWGREFESVVTGRGINFFRASKETCKMMTEREQCGKLRRAVSTCDIINSIQIAMNMQRAIERCDQVSGIIDQNPATIVEGMSGLINGEVATGFLNNFLG